MQYRLKMTNTKNGAVSYSHWTTYDRVLHLMALSKSNPVDRAELIYEIEQREAEKTE